jgi:transcriptional regulator with XRE-family HTH domain
MAGKSKGIPDPIDVAVGARIRLRRQELGMSQQVLAEHLGVTFQQVQKYERGSNRISASMLVRAARALRCPGGVLLSEGGGEGTAEPAYEDALEAELSSLLASPGATELLRAFAQIRGGEARSAVIAIVKGLAGGSARCAEGMASKPARG